MLYLLKIIFLYFFIDISKKYIIIEHMKNKRFKQLYSVFIDFKYYSNAQTEEFAFKEAKEFMPDEYDVRSEEVIFDDKLKKYIVLFMIVYDVHAYSYGDAIQRAKELIPNEYIVDSMEVELTDPYPIYDND